MSRGCVFFSAFGKRACKMKASLRRRIRFCQEGRLSVSPLHGLGLNASMGELRFAEKEIRQSPRCINGQTAGKISAMGTSSNSMLG